MHTLNFLRQTRAALLIVVSVSLFLFLCDIFLLLLLSLLLLYSWYANIQRRSFCTYTTSFFIIIRHTRCNIATNRRWRVYSTSIESINWCKIAHLLCFTGWSHWNLKTRAEKRKKINCSHRIGFDFICYVFFLYFGWEFMCECVCVVMCSVFFFHSSFRISWIVLLVPKIKSNQCQSIKTYAIKMSHDKKRKKKNQQIKFDVSFVQPTHKQMILMWAFQTKFYREFLCASFIKVK